MSDNNINLIWKRMNFQRKITPRDLVFDASEPGIEANFPDYDSSEVFTVCDKRRKSVKKIKVISFGGTFSRAIYIEPESLVRQDIAFDQFKQESADLLKNLQKYYLSIGHQPGSNPSKATLIGYRGKFRIKFEDKQLYKFAAIAAVHDN